MSTIPGASRRIDVEAVIDSARIGGFLITIVLLCAGVALLDGFDTLAISYVAPVIAGAWNLPREAFGPIFAAHYAGAALGAAAFGMLADRFGRRPAIIASTALFGVFALMTPFAHNFSSLFVLRALTGIGLGGALVNVIALVAEFSPERARATLVSVMYAAFPLGGVLGGPLSAFVVQNYGWELVFVIGGVAPLVLLVALIFLLPESLRFLVARNAPTEKTAYLMRRISGDASFTAADQFVVNEAISSNKQPVREIFSKEFFRVTTLLSFASFVTQLVIVFVITWMPTLLKAAGLPLGRAIIASATFSLGGILGSLLLARMIDIKKSYGVLVIAYIVSALAIALIGFSTGNANWVFAIVGLSGMAIVGAQVNLSAYSSTVYPTKIRSTGIGWIVGIGRAGAIAGALVGTVFVTSGLTLEVQYVIAGAPALLAGAAVYFVRTRQQHAA